MSANERKIAEAQECENKAKEHLKTSIWKMKTKPDYDSAAYEYDRAAVCYKNAEKLDLCLGMYLKSAECHGLNKNLFHEAKSKEAAAMIARDMKDMSKSGKLFKEAADGYLHSGVMDTAASTIDKAAKLMETNDEKVAIELYEFGLTLVQQADRSKMAMGFMQRLIKLFLKTADYNNAKRISIDLIDKYKEVNELPRIGQVVLGMVLMGLIKDDPIESLRQLLLLPDQGTVDFSQERSTANALVKAYEDGNEKRLQEILSRGYLRAMDNEYLRLLKLVHVPEERRRDEGQPNLVDAGSVMTDGNSTGLLPGSSTASNLIDEFRSALLKNSTKTLTSEAEALLQHTFGREWEQYQQPGLNIAIPSSLAPSHQFNLLSPSKNFPQIQSPDLDQNELELMMGENTLDWVSSLYNKLPSNELNDEGRNEFTDFDFLGLHRVSISEDQEEEDGTGDEQEQRKSNWPMACAECGYVAGNRKQLWRHGKRENHTTRTCSKPATFVPRQKKEKPDYKCEYCQYASKSRFNVLRHHQRVHVNQKSTSCSICSKSFKDHDTLKTHIRYTHDNERRHSCELYMPDNGRSRRRRRATIARSHVLTFHIIDEKVASGLRRVDDLIPDEFKQNWFVGRPSIEKDYYFFEQPGVGISGRAGQNLISEKGIEDINKEFSEISDFSLIVEDANGVPVSQPPKDRTVEYIFANISNIQSLSELKADKSALFKKTKKDESNLLKKYKNDEDAIMPMVYEEDEIAESSPDLGSSSTNKSRKESEDYFPEASILKNSILSSIAPSARSRNISQDSFWTLLKKTPEAKSTPKPKTAIERRRTLVANKTPETKEGLTTSKTPEVRTTLGAKRSLETKSTSEAKGTPETKRKTSDFVLQNSTLSNEKSNEANLSTTVQSNNSDVFDNEINLIPINNESLKSDSPCPLEDSLFGNLQSPESSKENLKPSLSPVLSFKKSDEDEQALAQEEEHIDKVSSQIGISKSEISKTSNNDRFEKSLDRVDVCEENEIFKMQEDGFHKSTGHIDNYESNENDVLIQEEEEFDRPPSQGGLYGNDEDEIRDDESIRSDTTCASNISRSSYVVRVIDGQQAFFLKGFRGEDSELAKLCFVCKQPTIQGWNSLFLKLSQEKIVKLGEGAFGEVYRGIFEKEMVALKIFPFKESLDSNKIYPEVNGNIMMPVDEVTNEVVLTQEVSKLCSYENGKTPNFIGLRRTFVLRGKYPEDFTKAWESYDKKKRSENDHPSQYSSSSRHYITMALELGGSDLEHFQIKNEKQVVSIFIQVALSLAIAETSLEFEHRDLHWGNILVKKITTKKPLEYCYKGKKVEVAHQGLSVKIIDFTLSRICKENTIIYRNLEEDPFLFEQEVTDMQFQVYKDMRTLTKGRWHEFWPGTNCLWLEYLADKLLYGVKGINVPSGIMKDKKEKLMEVFRLVRKYNSVENFIDDCGEFSELISNYWKIEE